MSKLSKLSTRHFVLAVTVAAAALLNACGGQEAPLPEQRQQAAMRAMSGPPLSAPSDSVAIFSGPRNNYVITRTQTGLEATDIVGSQGTVSLTGKAWAKFSDVTVNLLVGDKSKTIPAESLRSLIELYIAFFNRVPEADGLSYWIDQVKAGMTMDQLANNFYSAAIIYSDLTGYSKEMTNTDFVKIVYKNALGRTGASAPPDVDVKYWADHLTYGTRTKGSLVATMLTSAHTFAGDPTWGWMPQLLDNKVSVGSYFAVEQGLNYPTAEESITKTMDIVSKITPDSVAVAKSLINIRDARLNLSLTVPSAAGIYAFVGAIGGAGSLSGTGADARFDWPREIVVDAAGTLYVREEGLRIRRITKDGTVSSFLDGGYDLWRGLRYFSGRFMYTNADTQAELIYPDGSKTLIRAPNTDFTTENDVFDIDGNRYAHSSSVGVMRNGEVLAGGERSSVAKDGVGTDARFVLARNLTVFPSKMIYVLDQELASGKFQLRQITQAGVVTTLSTAKFEFHARIIPNSGTLPTVLDRNGIHKLQADGSWGFTPISDRDLIPNRDSGFELPDATADKEGNIFLVDMFRSLVIKVSPQGSVSILAGMAAPMPWERLVDGRGDAARLFQPFAASKDRAGNLYVIDPRPIDSRGELFGLTLRKISPEGVVTTLAAPGIWWGKADSTKMAETFAYPTGMVVDSQSNIWIFDSPALRLGGPEKIDDVGGDVIRKISPTGELTQVNGAKLDCFQNMWHICDLAFDGKGNLLVADRLGIRQLNADGTTTTFPEVRFGSWPIGFATDKVGNLYFARDDWEGRGIYKRSAAGTVTKLSDTVLSKGTAMLADDQGNLYFSRWCALFKISASGVETVVVGMPGCGNRLGNMENGSFGRISSLTWLGSNSMYVTADNAVLILVLP